MKCFINSKKTTLSNDRLVFLLWICYGKEIKRNIESYNKIVYNEQKVIRRKSVNEFAKLDVAIEVVAAEISKAIILYEKTKQESYLQRLESLNRERSKIYYGDMRTIDKLIQKRGE